MFDSDVKLGIGLIVAIPFLIIIVDWVKKSLLTILLIMIGFPMFGQLVFKSTSQTTESIGDTKFAFTIRIEDGVVYRTGSRFEVQDAFTQEDVTYNKTNTVISTSGAEWTIYYDKWRRVCAISENPGMGNQIIYYR